MQSRTESFYYIAWIILTGDIPDVYAYILEIKGAYFKFLIGAAVKKITGLRRVLATRWRRVYRPPSNWCQQDCLRKAQETEKETETEEE